MIDFEDADKNEYVDVYGDGDRGEFNAPSELGLGFQLLDDDVVIIT